MSYPKLFLHLFIFSLICSACGDDDNMAVDPVETESDPIVCLTEFGVEYSIDCDQTQTSSNNNCEIVYIGDFDLSDDSKMFFPQFCNNLSNVIEYANASGEKVRFEIVKKQYYSSCPRSNTFIVCPDDPDQTIAYQYEAEFAVIGMKDQNSELDIEIKIGIQIDRVNPGIDKVGEDLTIARLLNPGGTTRIVEFKAITNQQALSFEQYDIEEFFPNIDLLDKTFENVLSNDITNYTTPVMKHYFNKDMGLVAFVDLEDELWVLQ